MNVNDLIDLRTELSELAEAAFQQYRTNPLGESNRSIRSYGAGLDEAVKRIQELIDECDED